MHKKVLICCLGLLVIIGAGIAAYALSTDSVDDKNTNTNTQSSSNDSNANAQTVRDGESITASGAIICLPPKDTSGVQDMSCAIGLEADDGKNYALNAEDPTMIGSLPTGWLIEVTGTFAEQESKYDIAGVINVNTVQNL